MERPAEFLWSDDPDEPIPYGAVLIGISSFDWEINSDAGNEPFASVSWADWFTQGDKLKGEVHGPYSVPAAIERSRVFMQLWDFQQVVILIEDRSLWREDWGTLAADPGYEEQ